MEQVTLAVASGILTLSGTSGLTFQNGTANGSGTLNFIGTLSDINAALDGLTFSPAQDFSGSLTLNVNVNDLGNTGAGPAQNAIASVNLGVTAVAYTPSVTNASTTVGTQTAGGLVITPNPADGNAQGYYQITQISGGTLFLHDGLTPVSDGQFITFAQGALAGLTFTPAPNSVATGSFTVQASTAAAGGLVATQVTATITVSGSVSMPATAHTPTVTNASTTENQQSTAGLVITPNALDISMPIWFQITHITGGSLFLSDGMTAVAEGDFITARQGQAGLKFMPAANSVTAGSFDVQASATSDISGLGGSVVSVTIAVTPVTNPPLAPVNSVPAAQSGQQDTSLVFSTANGNAIAISDPGSDGSAEQITLTAAHGTLNLASISGITLLSGTGTGDASVTFTGSLAGINAALNGLTFVPVAHYSGAAAIHVVTQDLSATNNGMALTASSDVAISLAPANAPALPIQTNNPPLPPVGFTPAPASPPVTGFPVVDNTPAPAAGTVDSTGIQSASSGDSATSSPAAASTTTQKTAQAGGAVGSPIAASVAPILPRGLAARTAQQEVVSLPDLPRLQDLAVPTQGLISLSPIERLAMELGNPGAEGTAHTGAMMTPTHHNSLRHSSDSSTGRLPPIARCGATWTGWKSR